MAVSPDPDKRLLEQAETTGKLLAVQKRRLTTLLAAGESAPTSMLSQITKLEVQLRNIETVLRLRGMTRGGAAKPPDVEAELAELGGEVKRARRQTATWKGRARRAEASLKSAGGSAAG